MNNKSIRRAKIDGFSHDVVRLVCAFTRRLAQNRKGRVPVVYKTRMLISPEDVVADVYFHETGNRPSDMTYDHLHNRLQVEGQAWLDYSKGKSYNGGMQATIKSGKIIPVCEPRAIRHLTKAYSDAKGEEMTPADMAIFMIEHMIKVFVHEMPKDMKNGD